MFDVIAKNERRRGNVRPRECYVLCRAKIQRHTRYIQVGGGILIQSRVFALVIAGRRNENNISRLSLFLFSCFVFVVEKIFDTNRHGGGEKWTSCKKNARDGLPRILDF